MQAPGQAKQLTVSKADRSKQQDSLHSDAAQFQTQLAALSRELRSGKKFDIAKYQALNAKFRDKLIANPPRDGLVLQSVQLRVS